MVEQRKLSTEAARPQNLSSWRYILFIQSIQECDALKAGGAEALTFKHQQENLNHQVIEGHQAKSNIKVRRVERPWDWTELKVKEYAEYKYQDPTCCNGQRENGTGS